MSDSTSLTGPAEVVRAYYAEISEGRFAEAAARLSPELVTWIIGEGSWPLGGLHDVSSMKKIHAIVAERFPEGLSVTVKGLTVEGERVAVEAETYGTRVDGKVYNNQYHFLIVVKNGLICERREYLDTIHAKELLCDPVG